VVIICLCCRVGLCDYAMSMWLGGTMWQGCVNVAVWDYAAWVWLWQNGSEYGCVDYDVV
jgi:hypothetical protein